VAGTAQISWTGSWDAASPNLTYQLYRDGGPTPVYATTLASHIWQQPFAQFTDSGLAVGKHNYLLKMSAPNGDSWQDTTSVTITAGGAKPSTSTDLVLGKPTAQSSLRRNGTEPSRAVDGNTNGSTANNSVAVTGADPFAWWQTDLRSSTAIGSVTVSGQTGANSGARTTDYWIFVSDRPFDTSLSPVQQATQPGVWSSHQAGPGTVAVAAGTTGRYVLVQLNTAGNLGLAEVQVRA
jgi:hypothetical protein